MTYTPKVVLFVRAVRCARAAATVKIPCHVVCRSFRCKCLQSSPEIMSDQFCCAVGVWSKTRKRGRGAARSVATSLPLRFPFQAATPSLPLGFPFAACVVCHGYSRRAAVLLHLTLEPIPLFRGRHEWLRAMPTEAGNVCACVSLLSNGVQVGMLLCYSVAHDFFPCVL